MRWFPATAQPRTSSIRPPARSSPGSPRRRPTRSPGPPPRPTARSPAGRRPCRATAPRCCSSSPTPSSPAPPSSRGSRPATPARDRKSTRLNSSHLGISYAVFCLKRSAATPILHSFPTRRSSDLARIPEASPDQVARATAAAHRAFPGWAQTVPRDRAALLLKLADAVESRAAELARLEASNTGKPYAAALADELPAIADVFRFFAGAARCMTGAIAGEYMPGLTSLIRRDPLGVVASIAPWNYPLMMAAWKLAPAIAAGNTCVLKPSEQTPLTTLALAGLAAELFPPGVINVVTGRGPTVGAALIRQPEVRLASLTGSF